MSKNANLRCRVCVSLRKMPPRCAFYAGEVIKCRMLWCVTPACHLQETATFLENWLMRSVWPGLCSTVSAGARVRVCAHSGSLRLNLHACTRVRACAWVV